MNLSAIRVPQTLPLTFFPGSKDSAAYVIHRFRISRRHRGHQGQRLFRRQGGQSLDALLALTPDSVSDRLNRARLRLQSGDTKGAKEDFKWLLDHQPPDVDLERIAEIYRSL